jgi:hypothetical protein
MPEDKSNDLEAQITAKIVESHGALNREQAKLAIENQQQHDAAAKKQKK